MGSFKETVDEMMNMGGLLVPCTYPAVSLDEGKESEILKQRDVVIDGYEVIISYSKADYGTHYLEVVQIQGLNVPFLPFNVICKVGRTFLGSHCLALIEVFKMRKKLYCWMLYTNKESGEGVDPPETEPCTFEGFNFSALNPKLVNFY